MSHNPYKTRIDYKFPPTDTLDYLHHGLCRDKAEPPTSPPELSKEKQDLQDDVDDLQDARDNLLGALEILESQDFDCGEIKKMIETIEATISVLQWKINAPEGVRE